MNTKKVHPLERPILAATLSSFLVAEIVCKELLPSDFTGSFRHLFNAIAMVISSETSVDHAKVAEVLAREEVANPWEIMVEVIAHDTLSLPYDGISSAVQELKRFRVTRGVVELAAKGDLPAVRKLLDRTEPSTGIAELGRVTPEDTQQFIRLIEANAAKKTLGPSTGIAKLDDAVLGLAPGFLWAVGAPTSAGKTQLLCQILIHAILCRARCAYFSLEIGRDWALARMIGAYLRINPTRVYLGNLTESERVNVQGTLEVLSDTPLYIFRREEELHDICQTAREVKTKERGLDVIAVDFIQNIGVRGVSNSNERMAAAATGLQSLAAELGACVLVASQLSNETVREKGSGILSYRYASELGHAADVGFELVPHADGTVDLCIKKNRSGKVGKILLRWAGDWSHFEVIEDRRLSVNSGMDLVAGV